MTATESLNLASVGSVLSRHRRFVLQVLAASFVLGVILSFVLPPTYEAGAVLLPPVESDVFGSLGNAKRALSSFSAFGLLTQTYTPADEFQAILKSETTQRSLVQRFGLMAVYKARNMDSAVMALRHHVRINLSSDGTISITVSDRQAQRAADMANAFADELEKFNQDRRRRRARAQMVFISGRIAATGGELQKAEDVVRRFGESRHTPIVSSEDRSAAEGAAALLSRKAALEVKRQVLGAYLDPGSDELNQTDLEIHSLDTEISKLPALQLEGARLVRDLRVQEELFTLLKAQEQEFRLKENFNVPTVELLDRAHPPDRRSSPKRKLVVLGMMLAGFVLGLGGALVRERQGRSADRPAVA